jgi:hypothetical protein
MSRAMLGSRHQPCSTIKHHLMEKGHACSLARKKYHNAESAGVMGTAQLTYLTQRRDSALAEMIIVVSSITTTVQPKTAPKKCPIMQVTTSLATMATWHLPHSTIRHLLMVEVRACSPARRVYQDQVLYHSAQFLMAMVRARLVWRALPHDSVSGEMITVVSSITMAVHHRTALTRLSRMPANMSLAMLGMSPQPYSTIKHPLMVEVHAYLHARL